MNISRNVLKSCELLLRKNGFQPPSLGEIKPIIEADIPSSIHFRESLSDYNDVPNINFDTADRDCFLDSFVIYFLPKSRFAKNGWPTNMDNRLEISRMMADLVSVIKPLGWTASPDIN